MPQSEYIKYLDNNKGEVVKEYSPRLIKYTKENLKNLYETSDENIERFFNTESIFDEDLKELPLNSTTEEYESVASIADYIQSYSPEDRAEIAREINNGEISIKCK